MPKNWNTTVSIQEAKAAYAVGDDLDAYCFLYEGDRVRPVRITASGNIVTLPPYVPPATLYTKTGRFIESLIADIVPIQSGSGDPSPDNVRPIRGWTRINIQSTGTNLWDEEWELGAINGSNGRSYNDNTQIRTKNYIHVKPSTPYYFKLPAVFNYAWYDANHTYISGINSATPNYPRNASVNAVYLKFSCRVRTYDNNISINYPSTYTNYYAYTGHTYAIDWETEAGTVYGGTLNATTGELTITDAMIASYAGEPLPATWISDRDVYAEGTTPTIGAQVVYKLAVPQTYQLTPTEVTLLLGENNIFADTGPINLTYIETQEV